MVLVEMKLFPTRESGLNCSDQCVLYIWSGSRRSFASDWALDKPFSDFENS